MASAREYSRLILWYLCIRLRDTFFTFFVLLGVGAPHLS